MRSHLTWAVMATLLLLSLARAEHRPPGAQPLSDRRHAIAPAILNQAPGSVTRVSIATDGTPADGYGWGESNGAWKPVLSADGRYIAFSTAATNLVPGDTNLAVDVFVHDRYTGETSRVNRASDGTEAERHTRSGADALSADGRFIAFSSEAGNLVSSDTNRSMDVFVHDRHTGETTRISIASDGAEANNHSWGAAISADGRFIAFESQASNLVPGDANGVSDVFVHDRQTGETRRVSVASTGAEANAMSYAPAMSADGRFIAFESTAGNLVPMPDCAPRGVRNSPCAQIFVHDRQTGITHGVSVRATGTMPNDGSWDPAISADGRLIAFSSRASNLVASDTNKADDIFVYDRETGELTRVSIASSGEQANQSSAQPALSANGRFVVFQSTASNLASPDACRAETVGATFRCVELYLHDRQTGETTRVSVAYDGSQADASSTDAVVSADGRFVAFESEADNLVPASPGAGSEIFVLDRYAVSPTGDIAIHPRFQAFWQQHGGLAIFGRPVTKPVDMDDSTTSRSVLLQWFERGRLESHPENAQPYTILVGRVGAERLEQQGIDWTTEPEAPGPQDGCLWFEQTRHTVCDQQPGLGFKSFWENHGVEFDGRPGISYAESLALFGLPLSQPRMETNSSGHQVLTQWFERARLEWHPDEPAAYRVLTGRLGHELQMAR